MWEFVSYIFPLLKAYIMVHPGYLVMNKNLL